MPFTATHVAAVVPIAWLCRWQVPLSALAIGSMIPDVAGFFPRLFDYPTTHSFQGIVTHSVPLGIIAFYLFHSVLKQPLVDLLPPFFSQRLEGWSRGEMDLRPARILVVALCVALGALTHVVWDAFTHGYTWGTAMFPALNEVLVLHNGRPIRAFAIVQHGSSLLLLPPLVLGFFWWVMRQPSIPSTMTERVRMPRTVSWTMGVMILVGAWIYLHSLRDNVAGMTWLGAIRITVKDFGALMIILLLAYGIGMQLLWWSQARQRTRRRSTTLPADGASSLEGAVISLEPRSLPEAAEGQVVCTTERAHEVLRPHRPASASPTVKMAGSRPS